MTIKELYSLAQEKGKENCKIVLDYNCNDDYYNYCNPVQPEEIEFTKRQIRITICNY